MKRKLIKAAAILAAVLILAPASYVVATFKDLRGIFSVADTISRSKTENIIVHHDDVPRAMALYEIQQTHLERWHDVFPYTLFCKDGKVYLTRELEQKTSHAIGYNDNSIAVCIHTESKKKFRDMFNLWLVVKILQWIYDIPTENVLGHGETADTLCPEIDMNRFRKMLNYEIPYETKFQRIPLEKFPHQ